LQPTFSNIRTQVFQVWCGACHTSAGRAPEAGLSLDAAAAYQSLVNVASNGKPGAVRVVPGDPASSYLIHKLEGRSDIAGERMPLGGPFLAQSDIDVIRTWISQGAANN
jgi:mono/diheme cytochrome c family protein